MFEEKALDVRDSMLQQPTLAPVIDVPTSTCILYDRSDPHLVLVGLSHKHSKPVLPGGKIDSADLDGTNLKNAALSCIVREIREETGANINDVRLFDVFCHGDADVRSVPASTLKDTLVSSEAPQFPADMLVTARYGNPDYVFIGEIGAEDVAPSAELYQLGFIDIRSVPPGALGAAHSGIVERYREYVWSGAFKDHGSESAL